MLTALLSGTIYIHQWSDMSLLLQRDGKTHFLTHQKSSYYASLLSVNIAVVYKYLGYDICSERRHCVANLSSLLLNLRFSKYSSEIVVLGTGTLNIF